MSKQVFIKPDIYFKEFDEIYSLVVKVLEPYPIEQAEYQYRYRSTFLLDDQLALSHKYASLYCISWICANCYGREWYATKYDVCCDNCFGFSDHNAYFFNKNIGPGIIVRSIMNHGDRYNLGLKYSHVGAFEAMLEGVEDKDKFINQYKTLEGLFEASKGKRKSFFTNKFVLQKLLEHYGLAGEKRRTIAEKRQRKEWERLGWPSN